jgi:hypothetical protein
MSSLYSHILWYLLPLPPSPFLTALSETSYYTHVVVLDKCLSQMRTEFYEENLKERKHNIKKIRVYEIKTRIWISLFLGLSKVQRRPISAHRNKPSSSTKRVVPYRGERSVAIQYNLWKREAMKICCYWNENNGVTQRAVIKQEKNCVRMHDEEALLPVAPTPTVWYDILQARVRLYWGYGQGESETRVQKWRTKGGEEKGHRMKDRVYSILLRLIPLNLLGVHQGFVGNSCFHFQGISEKYLHTSQPYLFPPWTWYCRLLRTFRKNLLSQSPASEWHISTGIINPAHM